MNSPYSPLRAGEEGAPLTQANTAIAKLQQLRGTGEKRACRFWPVWVAAITIACSTGAPGGYTTDAGLDPSVEAGVESGPTWCEVQTILARRCQRCHALPTAHGAPFALLTYADTQELDSKGDPRFLRIARAIDDQLMPPQYLKLAPPVEPLTDAESATLLDWCAEAAPLTGPATCSDAP